MPNLQRVATRAWLAVFLAVYVPAAGHGFVKDDFNWILSNTVRSTADFGRAFAHADGFYRPIVGLTFAANELLFGTRPFGYGLTNLTLALLVGAGIIYLCRGLGLGRGAAILAAALWLLNFHGIRWGILWLSGRTSLLACLGAAWAAGFVVRGRPALGALALAFALFSKEEALLMGAVLLVWTLVLPVFATGRARIAGAWFGWAALATSLYLALRQASGAMTPSTAPSYYTFTFARPNLAANAVEYADRVGTLAVVVAAAALATLGCSHDRLRARRELALCCAAWIVGGLGLTFFLPVRSGLYALLPSIGACVLAAAVAGDAWRTATPSRRRLALIAAIVTPVVLSPIYLMRTTRWVELADLSAAVLADLDARSKALPSSAVVTIRDDRTYRANLESAFGADFSRAFTFWTGRTLHIVVLEPDATGDAAAASETTPVSLRLRLHEGRLAPAG